MGIWSRRPGVGGRLRGLLGLGGPGGRGRRRGRGPEQVPDPALPMFLDAAEAAQFARTARQVFAEHGLECRYADGQLLGSDGHSYGLTNVALLAAAGDRRSWPGLLHQHVRGIVAAHRTPRQRELAAVADRLHLRLWAAGEADAPNGEVRPAPGAAIPLGEGLVGLACIDHPEYVETLTGAREVERLGGWEAVRAAALANLGRLRADHVITVGEQRGHRGLRRQQPLGEGASRVQLSSGGFFNASRVFTMPNLLREDFLLEEPAHGVLFVVPNRHVVAVHPVTGEGMFAAVSTLLEVAAREYAAPGAVSPEVWFWCGGVVEQVTRRAEAGAVELVVAGALESQMRVLGLVDET